MEEMKKQMVKEFIGPRHFVLKTYLIALTVLGLHCCAGASLAAPSPLRGRLSQAEV